MTPPDDSKRAEILVEVSRYDVNLLLFLWRGCVSRRNETKWWISSYLSIMLHILLYIYASLLVDSHVSFCHLPVMMIYRRLRTAIHKYMNWHLIDTTSSGPSSIFDNTENIIHTNTLFCLPKIIGETQNGRRFRSMVWTWKCWTVTKDFSGEC